MSDVQYILTSFWIVIDTIIIIIVKGGNFYNYTHNVRPVTVNDESKYNPYATRVSNL